MKKIFMIVQDKDVLAAMTALRDMDLVHVEHVKIPAGRTLNELKEKAQTLHHALDILSAAQGAAEPAAADDWFQQAGHVIHLAECVQHIKDDLAKRKGWIDRWEPWGDFDPRDVAALRERGVVIRFVEYPRGEKIEWPPSVVVEPVGLQGGMARALVISRTDEKLPCPVLDLPPVGLTQLREQVEHGLKAVRDLEKEIRECGRFADGFRKALDGIEADLAFREVYEGRGAQEALAYLQGFVPSDRCGELERRAREEHWGLLVTEPSADDAVPTLLRNPRWVEMIKPVFRLINVVPGYQEMDVSLVFLLFFSVFFGILIGDAGYGLIFGVLTAVMQMKTRRKVKDQAPFILMYILSGCAVAWGLMTGVCFGKSWMPAGSLPTLVPWLQDDHNVQMLCLLIGAFHLSIAHVWRTIMKFPSWNALSEIGWLSTIWGMYFVAKMFLLESPLPSLTGALLIGGPVLVVLFFSPSKNILKTIGLGLGDLLLHVVNTFTDIISYIRLYAVGFATVQVADAFNQAASGIGFNNVLAGFLSAMILVAGHVFNMTLGAMAILVHGLRLNVLEFSSHLGLEWKGTRYQPFGRMEKV